MLFHDHVRTKLSQGVTEFSKHCLILLATPVGTNISGARKPAIALFNASNLLRGGFKFRGGNRATIDSSYVKPNYLREDVSRLLPDGSGARSVRTVSATHTPQQWKRKWQSRHKESCSFLREAIWQRTTLLHKKCVHSFL